MIAEIGHLVAILWWVPAYVLFTVVFIVLALGRSDYKPEKRSSRVVGWLIAIGWIIFSTHYLISELGRALEVAGR